MLQEASKVYQANSRAIGVLWAIFTICLAIISVVVFIEPYWIGDSVSTPQAGHFGLYHYCAGNGDSNRELLCQGSFSDLSSIPSAAFKAASFFVLTSMVLVVGCIVCFALFFFCNTATVYKTCAWMQLLCAVCLLLGCVIFPEGWDTEVIRDMCGENTGRYALGNCSVRWAYILAIVGILDAFILSFLAFVLGNRQTDFLQQELRADNKVYWLSQSGADSWHRTSRLAPHSWVHPSCQPLRPCSDMELTCILCDPIRRGQHGVYKVDIQQE